MKKSLSITMRFGVAMTAVVVLLLALSGAWQYVSSVGRLQGELLRMANTTAIRAGSAVQVPLWEMYNSAVLSILETEMQDAGIVSLFVWSADHKNIAYGYARNEQGKPVESQTASADSNRVVRAEAPIVFVEEGQTKGQTIGYMEVHFSRNSVILERRRILFSVLASILAGILVAPVLALWVSRSISRPIVMGVHQLTAMADANCRLAETVQIMAGGDLSRDLRTDISSVALGGSAQQAFSSRSDEIGVLFRSLAHLETQMNSLASGLRAMSENMGASLLRVASVTEEVYGGSGEIAKASQTLSQGATETAASLEEIGASATQIGQQAKANAETATQANQLAATAKTAAETGANRMQALNSSMAAITESSAQIAKIIKTIDDIAFQTNILALNAAVEAARAGRHGKGFAVVAEEVRSLAARSAKAARETADLIEGSKNRVDEGNRMAKETAAALAEIVDGIVKVGDLVGEMAASSNEQALGIDQISQGLGQIDQVTQQNTATAEETAAASEELSGQSDELRSLIGQFKLKGGGSPAATRREAHRAQKKSLAAKPVSNEEIISLEVKEFDRY